LGPDGNVDQTVDRIVEWVQKRLDGVGAPFYRLEAPSGFGKSWSLRRFVDLHRAAYCDRLIIMGPLLPPPDYTPDWWLARVDEHILTPGIYPITKADIRRPNEDSFQGHIYSLVEDLEAMPRGRHLLFIMDEIDHATDPEALEIMLLTPIVQHFDNKHTVSLLLALRNDHSFKQVEYLRSRKESKRRQEFVPAFVATEARQQIILLLQSEVVPDDPQNLTDAILNSLPMYTWGVPALNTELVKAGAAKARAGDLVWRTQEIGDCVLLALRKDPTKMGDQTFLQQAGLFRRTVSPPDWDVPYMAKKLGCNEIKASELRDQLDALGLIEKPQEATIGFYQFSEHWNSIFEAWCALDAPMPDPMRGAL
jgi:hypothetical protein